MFEVIEKACDTCIFKPQSGFNLPELMDQIKDDHGFFERYRVCHHHPTACCRGFWNTHKDDFQVGQIAQRLGFVQFVPALPGTYTRESEDDE